jgi:hypothetical protein
MSEVRAMANALESMGYNLSKLEQIPLGVLRGFAGDISWGSYGVNGDEELSYKPIAELDTSHIRNILITQTGKPPLVRAVLISVFEERIALGLEHPAEEPIVSELSSAEILVNSLLGEDNAELV